METIQVNNNAKIIVADVMDGKEPCGGERTLRRDFAPYWGLRDYGFDGQIGSEKTPELFVEKLLEVFRGVRLAMRDDGVLFVNLGDSYNQYNGNRGNGASLSGTRKAPLQLLPQGTGLQTSAISIGNQVGIPWRVALAMQADGWIIRKDIIWSKPSTMPESVSGWRWVQCKNKTKNGDFSKLNERTGSGFCFKTSKLTEYEKCEVCEKCHETNGLVLRRGSWRPTTVDFGRLDNGKIALVESHHPYAAGHYGDSHEAYLLWAMEGWKSVVSEFGLKL